MIVDWQTKKLVTSRAAATPEVDVSKLAPVALESSLARDGTKIPMFVRRPAACGSNPACAAQQHDALVKRGGRVLLLADENGVRPLGQTLAFFEEHLTAKQGSPASAPGSAMLRAMAGIESFDDVRELGEPELRALLDAGRPEERVWALWALALRSAEDAPAARGPSIAELARRAEPDPGVRRNLAVILAGHGQLELLVALADSDPAPEVRAAAMALVARLAVDGKLPARFVIDHATTDAPEVRTAVLGTIFANAPSWLADIAERLLGDRDADVRYEAFDALIRCGRTPIALAWLEEVPEPEARLTLMRWSARGRIRACAEQLAAASRRLRRMLIESVRTASWDDLGASIGDEPALIRALARRSGSAFDQIPLAPLLRATLREPSDSWIVMVRDRLVRLDAPPADIASLLPDYRDMCAERVTIIGAHMAELRRVGSDTARAELEALDDERTALESALEAAARLLVH